MADSDRFINITDAREAGRQYAELANSLALHMDREMFMGFVRKWAKKHGVKQAEAEREISDGFRAAYRVGQRGNPQPREPYKQTQTWKISKPEKDGDIWRIRRHDGALVGAYETKALAQKAIDTSAWINPQPRLGKFDVVNARTGEVLRSGLVEKEAKQVAHDATYMSGGARFMHPTKYKVVKSNPQARLGMGERFKRLTRKLSGREGVYDPKGLAAWIGRRKYGKRKFQALAARGRHAHRANPDEFKEAEEVAEGFHGKLMGTVTEVMEEEKYRGELAVLGYMEDLEVDIGQRKPEPIKFPEMPLSKRPVLAATGDREQLYLVGGDQALSEESLEFLLGTEDGAGKDFVVIGPVAAITYWTAKHHLSKEDKKLGMYRHEFAEEGGEQPLLVYDNLNGQLYLMGGSYQVEDEGIRN